MGDQRVKDAGMDLTDPYLRRVITLARQMTGMPRHLSPACGGLYPDRAASDRDGADWQRGDAGAVFHRVG